MARKQRRWTRRLASACLLALASNAVAAPAPVERPRVHLEVSLGAAQPGSEGLGYFVPEVTRALDEALHRAGVIVAPGAEAMTVELDEKPGDRVLLTARVHGRIVELEGTTESLDALVDELATRVAPLCVVTEMRHVPTKVEPVKAEPAKLSKPEVAKVEPPKPEPPKLVAVVTTPPVVAPPASPPKLEPAPQPRPETKPETKPDTKVDPYGPDARVADAPPVFERGRVVVHTLPDPPLDAPQGTGTVATEALYAVLQHRLRLAIVPMGIGVTTLSTAADEGVRARSRHVIMGRLDSFSYYVGAEGPVARVRLELSIVSEGHLVLRRVLYAETPAGAVNNGLAQGRSGRLVDPVYLAITHALDGELGELQLALLGPSNAPR